MDRTRGNKPFNSNPADVGLMPPQDDGGDELDSSDLVDSDGAASNVDRMAAVIVEPWIDLHQPGDVGEEMEIQYQASIDRRMHGRGLC